MIGVNFLWHMHQPDYRSADGGPAILPWVRLHAVRGYLDLLAVLEQHPRAHCVVNFSGILLEQLLTYSPQRRDLFAELTLRDPASFSPEERQFVFANFFSANENTLIQPQERYRELLQKRESLNGDGSCVEAATQFSDQELRDLLVWFNLAWIGFTGRQRTDVQQLFAKGRDFTVDDQRQVLSIHDELLAQVLPRCRAHAASGSIELSFTPYHHPILPLLHDLAGEGTRVEGDPLPQFNHAWDAAEQVRRGMEWYARAFGQLPLGAWPAEGSVSDKALGTLARAGVKWAATDQQNLPDELQGRVEHLTPKLWRSGSDQVLMLFRDTRLADNVGFVYASWDPHDAAAHLVENIASLGAQSDADYPIVSVILDGENPWEAYPDGGEGFLHALFAQLGAHAEVECVTPSQVLEREWPAIEHVSAGSWIGGNFDIWTKDTEARQAWRLLARAREDIDSAGGAAIPGRGDEAGKNARPTDAYCHLLAAEGSDWFWWYGDTFQSDQKPQFDALFRGHLIVAYELSGLDVPPELRLPISSDRAPLRSEIASDFRHWKDVVAVAKPAQGAMARGDTTSVEAEPDLSDWVV